jgi:septal ring factor EnvC (AmiA/AmiB activator)
MLLNEFLKEHRKVEAQERTIAEQAASLKDERDEIAQFKSALARQRQSFESRAARQEEEIATLERGLKRVSERLENSAASLVAAKN